ncbi:YvrJ family protein [Desulforamulus aeronauticus]|uniref:YvrJ family protein n=1 Tax=Desulforamulus aeronauticus TaxID=53343 RepID=UPI0030833CA4
MGGSDTAEYTIKKGKAMEELFRLASNYGFPMVVVGYLLLRLEPPFGNCKKVLTS